MLQITNSRLVEEKAIKNWVIATKKQNIIKSKNRWNRSRNRQITSEECIKNDL